MAETDRGQAVCYRGTMIYVSPLASREGRSLRRLVRQGAARIAQRAQIVLLSAEGLAVPDIAELLACCRRTVRRWIHRFQARGVRGLLDLPQPQPSAPPEATNNSAMRCGQEPEGGRSVPAIPLTVPEVRRLLNGLLWHVTQPAAFVRHWSDFRRYKQALAMRCHYRKRGADPPPFEQVRL
ncbi:MAG: helix-turn-helix domain-containing protein [Chloroflexi bacterium]|nr:helix-turn-helix domain-containing protein [Chloroflexota bacterium]